MRNEQASNLLTELEQVIPALHLGINIFLEGPSPSLTPVEAGWKILVDINTVNLENLSEIEDVAARFWLKTKWVHRNVRHLLMIYTPRAQLIRYRKSHKTTKNLFATRIQARTQKLA